MRLSFVFLFVQLALMGASSLVSYSQPSTGVIPFSQQNFEQRAVSEKPSSLLLEVGKVDLNHATGEEIQLLPFLGATLSERIIQHRNKHGSFKSLSDLREVKGIGSKTLQRVAPWVCLNSNCSIR